MSNSKACTKCGQIKPFDDFVKDKYKKTGVTSDCRNCRAQRARQKRIEDPAFRKIANKRSKAYYWANKEKMSRNYKLWVKSNLKNRRQIDERFRQRHREEQRLRATEYRKKNPEKRLLWGKNNPEKQAAIYAKRSFARRGGLKFDVTLKEIQKMYASPCFYCGKPSEHIDHIVPLSRGGRHSIGNLTGSCANCNLSKGAKFITEWKKGRNEN